MTPSVHIARNAHSFQSRVRSIGDLLDAALATEPPTPTEIAPNRRRQFRLIEGGRKLHKHLSM
jgi:hypothetical protein